jgi:integrase
MSDTLLTTGKKTKAKAEKPSGPHSTVRHGSVTVPIYAGTTGGKIRYTIAFHLDGQRHRRMFTDLDKAKREAKLAAEKIQSGLATNNDLTSRERDLFHAARKLLSPLGTPLVAAIEEYVIARKVLGEVPLVTAAKEYKRQNEGVRTGVSMAKICDELCAVKKQDGFCQGYQDAVKATLTAFSKAFPGSIQHVKSEQIEKWLRDTTHNPATRNNRLMMIRMLFGFAKQRNYLPKTEMTEAMRVGKSKVPVKDTEIYTPEQFEKILRAAPDYLIPYLVMRGFCGIRSAELCRLDWSAVNLERRIIELRATQAKTAARRLIPICDNLAAWLAPLVGKGRIIPKPRIRCDAAILAKEIGVGWPKNALRHSYISYRVALTGDVPRTALESGNSPEIIFRHYHEMVEPEAANAWFGIMPPDDWAVRAVGGAKSGEEG